MTHPFADYLGLFPEKVWPTAGIEVLEREYHLLFIKSIGHTSEITPAQRKIFILLNRFGRVLDAPGSITVACVWSMEDARGYVVFDDNGEHPLVTTTSDGWRAFLKTWWDDHADL